MAKARENSVEIACGTALPCAGKEELEHVIEKAKYGLYKSFTYSQLSPLLIVAEQYSDLTWVVMKMHGIYHTAETRKRRGRPKKLAKQTQNDENEAAKSKNDVGTRADANCADQE
ncbi:hypothetical protein Tco_0637004 [Tanacetum coccineum]